ncbi:glucosyltransferase [Podila humilis]|nr:glucosyltransferase [Podila humilis]
MRSFTYRKLNVTVKAIIGRGTQSSRHLLVCTIFFATAGLLKHLHPDLTRQERYATAAVVITFPLLWFFNFVYYTDGGSGSAIAVTFRQTNIIWSLFIIGTSLLDLSTTTERRSFDPKAAFIHSPIQILGAVSGFVRSLFSKFKRTAVMILPYCGLLAGFVVFVRWNGGIVLATALTLIPSPLLEFRYFMTPYLIYRLAMRQPKGTWLFLELVGYCVINTLTVWMFMTKPFRWAHEDGVQRFMW